MTKEEKRAMLRAWKEKQEKKYILKKREAASLFKYLNKNLEKNSCDHTMKYTMEWLENKFSTQEETITAILEEVNDDGGFCDGEVLFNCYERYELE